MNRTRNTAIAIFIVALLASLAVHLPIYSVLGILARAIAFEESHKPPAPIEVEFVSPEDSQPTKSKITQNRVKELIDKRPREIERQQRAQKQEPHTKAPEVTAKAETKVVPPKPKIEDIQKQAVKQRSRDPNVEPPPDTEYIARENQRVEEETTARIRNYQRDDEQPTPGKATHEAGEEPGNSDEQDIADMRNRTGSEARSATPQEAELPHPNVKPTPPKTEMARGDTTKSRAPGRVNPNASARASGQQNPTEWLTIRDQNGTFQIPRSRIRQESEQASSKLQNDSGATPGRSPETGDRGRGRGFTKQGPDLRISWSQFEDVVGPDQLRDERETYMRERRSRQRGSNRQEEWRQFRAAIENFLPDVRPGNQTALNAAASPFADFLAEMHVRIHREFADRFLSSLPSWGTSPFANPSLHTTLEIVLNRDGTIYRVGVVHTSGLLAFDHGAFVSVMRAQPYPEPPPQILSGNGRVYVHWGFYRNERQCGTFNAEPFILPHPPGTPRPGPGPFQDQLAPDSVVPPTG